MAYIFVYDTVWNKYISINLSIIPVHATADWNFIHIQKNYHFSCIAALQSISWYHGVLSVLLFLNVMTYILTSWRIFHPFLPDDVFLFNVRNK